MSRAAAALSAIFQYDDRKQPERMAAPVSATMFRCRRSRRSIAIPSIWMRWSKRLTKRWRAFPIRGRPEIVFSAHSVPVSVIAKGDPYQRHIEETVDLVMRARRMALSPPALLPEQGGRQQVAAAVAAPHHPRSGGGASARSLRRAHRLCLRPCGNAGRDRPRGARRSGGAWNSAIRDDVRLERFAGFHCGPGGIWWNRDWRRIRRARASAWSQRISFCPRRGGCPHPPGGAKLRKVWIVRRVVAQG